MLIVVCRHYFFDYNLYNILTLIANNHLSLVSGIRNKPPPYGNGREKN